MKKVIRNILIIRLVALIAIQFIRTAKNTSSAAPSENDITKKFTVPEDVHKILVASCYDCHSNNTVYPWYANIQPTAWWLAGHIEDGKRGLNFSEFGRYSLAKQYHRFEDINDEIKGGDMPLSSYTFIHTYAKLSDAQKQIIYNWTATCQDYLKSTYPADSLIKKKRA